MIGIHYQVIDAIRCSLLSGSINLLVKYQEIEMLILAYSGFRFLATIVNHNSKFILCLHKNIGGRSLFSFFRNFFLKTLVECKMHLREHVQYKNTHTVTPKKYFQNF